MFPKRAKAKLAVQAQKLESELRVQLEALVESVEDGAGLRLDGTLSHLPSGEQVW